MPELPFFPAPYCPGFAANGKPIFLATSMHQAPQRGSAADGKWCVETWVGAVLARCHLYGQLKMWEMACYAVYAEMGYTLDRDERAWVAYDSRPRHRWDAQDEREAFRRRLIKALDFVEIR